MLRNSFAFDADTRERLAAILRRHQDPNQRNPAAVRGLIRRLEGRARSFVESKGFASQNSDQSVRDALAGLRSLDRRTMEAIRELPPRARGELFDKAGADVLGPTMASLKALQRAVLLCLVDLAPNPKGGRRPDHRGQQLAADIGLTLNDVGVATTAHIDGPWAQHVELIFVAVGHKTGDLRTLLAGALRKIPELQAHRAGRAARSVR